MNNNSQNVKFGKPKSQGAIYCAAADTPLPTDATTPLDETKFSCLGYVGEDGLTETTTREAEEIKAWGGDTVARPQTSYGKEYAFKCIEFNDTVLKVAYGEENIVEGAGAITIKSNAKELPSLVWVFELMLDATTVLRKVVPLGKITELGDIVYVDNNPISFDIKVAAFPNADGDYEIAYKASIAPTVYGALASGQNTSSGD